MRKTLIVVLMLTVFCGLALAQDASKIAKYVLVETEQVNSPQAYDSSYKQFKQASEAANSKFYWVGLTPITGQLGSVTYLAFSDTFAGIDAALKEDDAIGAQAAAKNANFMKEAAEGTRMAFSGISVYHPEMSFRPDMVPMAETTRYRLTSYTLKPGMNSTFMDLVKDVIALDKDVRTAHWLMYESLSSTNGSEFTVVTPLKSLADLDNVDPMAMAAVFTPAVRRDIDRRVQQCVASVSSSYVAVQPRYSRPAPEIVAANPSFWTVKEEAPVMAAKPAKGKKAAQSGK